MCKDDLKYWFVNFFLPFNIVKLCIFVYLCLVPHPTVFVTHLWKHGTYIHMCICMYILHMQSEIDWLKLGSSHGQS